MRAWQSGLTRLPSKQDTRGSNPLARFYIAYQFNWCWYLSAKEIALSSILWICYICRGSPTVEARDLKSLKCRVRIPPSAQECVIDGPAIPIFKYNKTYWYNYFKIEHRHKPYKSRFNRSPLILQTWKSQSVMALGIPCKSSIEVKGLCLGI